MRLSEPDIDSIQFGVGEDDRVVIVGRNLLFKFGKLVRLDASMGGERLTIVIENDRWAEKAQKDKGGFLIFLRSLVAP